MPIFEFLHLLINLGAIAVVLGAFVLVIITCIKVIKYINFKMKDKQ